MSEILPCPFCEAECEVLQGITPSNWWIVCDLECGCGYASSHADTEARAIIAHNRVYRACNPPAAPDDAKQAAGWIPTQQQFLESVNHIRKELSTYLRLRDNKEGVVDSLKSLDHIIFNEEMVLQAIASGRYAPKDAKAPDDGKGQPVAWRYQDVTGKWCYRESMPQTEKGRSEAQPLYPHPAPQGWQQGAAKAVVEYFMGENWMEELPLACAQRCKDVEAILKQHQEGKT